jgi:hypothetical protein
LVIAGIVPDPTIQREWTRKCEQCGEKQVAVKESAKRAIDG